MGATVRFYDPFVPGIDDYTGRWSTVVGPFTLDPAADGAHEFHLAIRIPGFPDAFIGLYIGNDSATPEDLTGGFTFDSASPPAWATFSGDPSPPSYFGAKFFGTGGTFDPDVSWQGDHVHADYYDAAFLNPPFPLDYAATLDPDSDLSWSGIRYQARVTNPAGFNFGSLPDSTLRSVTWELNSPGTLELAVPVASASVALLVPGREVQFVLDGNVIWAGPLVRRQASMEEYSWQAQGLLWYFGRRYFGRADRVNYLTNSDFEDGSDPWTFEGGVGHSVSTAQSLTGTHSLKLTGTASAHDSYAQQLITRGHQFHPNGDLITISAWVYVPAGFTDTAIEDRGLYVERRNPADEVLDFGLVPIDADTLTDQWVEMRTQIPGTREGETIDVRLYPPEGDAYWDLATMTLMESLSFANDDVGLITETIVEYAQDRLPAFQHGKSDLRITTPGATVGVNRTRSYQFAEHGNVLDALVEFTHNGDADIRIGPDDRVFHAEAAPTGADTGITLSLATNLSGFTHTWDGEEAATAVVTLGPGDGTDRPEGAATDPAFLDGLTLEHVEVAPDGVAINELDSYAGEKLRVARHPEVLEVTTRAGLGATWLLLPVHLGDRYTANISWGEATIGGTWRAVRMTFDPMADTLRLTLNPYITPEEAMARFPNAVDACLAPGGGVWVVGSDGGVGAYGGAAFHGSMGGIALSAPVVAIVPHGSGGYWLAGADTAIYAFGDAPVRLPYLPMLDTEYPAGDRAITAAEAYDPSGDDTLIMIADDGATYIGALP